MTIPRPRPSLTVELAGIALSLARLPTLALGWRELPRGDGAPVLVVPGFLAGEESTLVLRWFLARLGYRASGWGLGRNRGDVERSIPRLAERVAALARREGQAVRLVGWSLGGVLSREAARAEPQAVRQIVTLGTPVVGGPKYTGAAGYYTRRGFDLDRIERQVAEINATPLPVPVSAIYSKRDGVVAWRACIDPNPDNRIEYHEVQATHAALGLHPGVLRIVARALAGIDRPADRP